MLLLVVLLDDVLVPVMWKRSLGDSVGASRRYSSTLLVLLSALRTARP